MKKLPAGKLSTDVKAMNEPVPNKESFHKCEMHIVLRLLLAMVAAATAFTNSQFIPTFTKKSWEKWDQGQIPLNLMFHKCEMHIVLRLLLAMVAAATAFTNSQFIPTLAKKSLTNWDQGDFFVRSAKWIPSGGAGLVSGRGNFRPGFTGRDWRSAIAEPNFKKYLKYQFPEAALKLGRTRQSKG
ncbi:hypothetical protein TELCIR_08922 [Teladorsagia circumcincta]|uniref:Uncharacterized protein n=1 Tax=Teladorsagia circumcincta TaxID=45464 RepID=A0A2G9UGA1_TELCI|nr:hypothetical protein TELCIR_08922 [Teladorsagia circumcincta]